MLDRTIQPKTLIDTKFDFIKPLEFKIRNSIPCFWIEDKVNASYKIELVFNAGTKHQKKKLVASFMSNLLLSGTNNLNSSQISERLDFYGGYLNTETDKDHTTITIYGLKKNILKILSLVQHNISNCKFPANEVENYRMISKEKFKQDQEKVSNLARSKFQEILFGKDTSYCQNALLKDFDEINDEDLIQMFASNIEHGLKAVFIVGGMDQNLKKELEGIPFYAYTNTKDLFTFNGQTALVEEIQKKAAIQSAIRIGNITIDRSNPDFIPFNILNTVFGGYFGSRLMSNIREDKGYTYGINSGIASLEKKSYFFISTEVNVDVYKKTLIEIKKEIDLLQTELISEKELEKVKNYLRGKFIQGSDGPFAMMERFKEIWLHHLDYSYYADFLRKIEDVTTEELREIANRHLNFDNMNKVIVGLPDN